jgi:hypothetical protein
LARDPIRILYYPDFFVDFTTLLKAILLFDELHFMDRPSMMFGAGPGQFGTIGAQSPLRQPYGYLLGVKYARAIGKLEPAKNRLQITDLSFAILDELVPTESVKKLRMMDAVRYRKESDKARQEFLEHLSVIQAKQAAIGLDGDYAGAIEKVITTEIKPAVQAFRNKLRTIDESLFGAVAKGVVGAAGGSSALTLFGDLSSPKILALTGAGAAYVAKATIDAILAERAAKRECSISYILSLDE